MTTDEWKKLTRSRFARLGKLWDKACDSGLSVEEDDERRRLEKDVVRLQLEITDLWNRKPRL